METNIIKWDENMSKRCFSRLKNTNFWGDNESFSDSSSNKEATKKTEKKSDPDGWEAFKNSFR
jgi:hypothetical protein